MRLAAAGIELRNAELDTVAAWMPRLVQRHLSTSGELECSSQPPPLFGDAARELHALALHLLDGGVHVSAHQVQLMMRTLGGRMRSKLGRRKTEDQPTSAGVGALKPERIAEELTSSGGILAEDDRMDTRVTTEQA